MQVLFAANTFFEVKTADLGLERKIKGEFANLRASLSHKFRVLLQLHW